MADSLAQETVKARVLILGQYFPEYSDSLNKALQYGMDDPPAALLKSRLVLEDVCAVIWKHFESSTAPSVYEIFNHEKIKEKVPKRVLSRIHSLRSICNIGVHGDAVTNDDVVMSINHLFALLDWFGREYKNISALPIPVQPAHSFIKYMKDCMHDKVFLLIILANTIAPALLFRFHGSLPKEFNRPFVKVYEGMFYKGWGFINNGFIFSFAYSLMLVLITSTLSWMIFKRFRNQNFESRLLSFELMFILIFSVQYVLLTIFDYTSNLW